MGNQPDTVDVTGRVVYFEVLSIQPTSSYFTINGPLSFEIVMQPQSPLVLQDVSVKLRKEEVVFTDVSRYIKSQNSNYIFQSVLGIPNQLGVNSSMVSLNPGLYKFPFTFMLSPDCLPSVEIPYGNKMGYVRYYIEAELISPYSHIKKELLVKILSKNLSPPKIALGSGEANLNAHLIVKKGVGKVNVTLQSDVYTINSDIKALVEVDNTRATMDSYQIKLSIFKRITFVNRNNQNDMVNDKKIAEKYFDAKIPKKTKRIMQCDIKLTDSNVNEYSYQSAFRPYPDIKDYNLMMPTVNGLYIKCNYFLRVTIYYEKFLAYSSRPRVEIPIQVVHVIYGQMPMLPNINEPQQNLPQNQINSSTNQEQILNPPQMEQNIGMQENNQPMMEQMKENNPPMAMFDKPQNDSENKNQNLYQPEKNILNNNYEEPPNMNDYANELPSFDQLHGTDNAAPPSMIDNGYGNNLQGNQNIPFNNNPYGNINLNPSMVFPNANNEEVYNNPISNAINNNLYASHPPQMNNP
ncbi:MAG: hypothetical protein MJ252_06415 [archaeon]|nr:hypothetical protein [archaeon]